MRKFRLILSILLFVPPPLFYHLGYHNFPQCNGPVITVLPSTLLKEIDIAMISKFMVKDICSEFHFTRGI